MARPTPAADGLVGARPCTPLPGLSAADLLVSVPRAFCEQWDDAVVDVVTKVRRQPVRLERAFIDVLLVERERVGIIDGSIHDEPQATGLRL